jgi:ACT domain-containing protein
MPEITEEHIRNLTREAIKQLQKSATPETVDRIVKDAVKRLQNDDEKAVSQIQESSAASLKSNRIIITAFGKNRSGILAGLTTTLAKYSCDILDLSQKLLQELFTVMLLVDISKSTVDFETIKTEMIKAGEELDLKVIIQHEDIFNVMHRI